MFLVTKDEQFEVRKMIFKSRSTPTLSMILFVLFGLLFNAFAVFTLPPPVQNFRGVVKIAASGFPWTFNQTAILTHVTDEAESVLICSHIFLFIPLDIPVCSFFKPNQISRKFTE